MLETANRNHSIPEYALWSQVKVLDDWDIVVPTTGGIEIRVEFYPVSPSGSKVPRPLIVYASVTAKQPGIVNELRLSTKYCLHQGPMPFVGVVCVSLWNEATKMLLMPTWLKIVCVGQTLRASRVSLEDIEARMRKVAIDQNDGWKDPKISSLIGSTSDYFSLDWSRPRPHSEVALQSKNSGF
jgi:hypothetical protein